MSAINKTFQICIIFANKSMYYLINYKCTHIFYKQLAQRLYFNMLLSPQHKMCICLYSLPCKSRKKNPQKLTQLSSRSHPRHLVGKRTAQKDTIIDITSDSQVNSNFPYRWSPASLTFNNYFYLFLYLYIT